MILALRPRHAGLERRPVRRRGRTNGQLLQGAPDTDRHAGRAGGLDSARRAEGPSAGGPATQEGATAPSLDDEAAAAIRPIIFWLAIDLALGNVIGSNLFNTLGVVGLAAVIQPMSVETQLLSRDIPVMCVLTLALFVLGYNFGKSRPGRINRLEGCLLLAGYIGYTVWLIESTFIRGA